MGKESITLSMKLAKTRCYEFECFKDNYSLTISTQECRINARKFNTLFNTKGTYSLQSFKTRHPIVTLELNTALQTRGKKLRSSKELFWNLYTV